MAVRSAPPEDYVGQNAHQLRNGNLVGAAKDLLAQTGHTVLARLRCVLRRSVRAGACRVLSQQIIVGR